MQATPNTTMMHAVVRLGCIGAVKACRQRLAITQCIYAKQTQRVHLRKCGRIAARSVSLAVGTAQRQLRNYDRNERR